MNLELWACRIGGWLSCVGAAQQLSGNPLEIPMVVCLFGLALWVWSEWDNWKKKKLDKETRRAD